MAELGVDTLPTTILYDAAGARAVAGDRHGGLGERPRRGAARGSLRAPSSRPSIAARPSAISARPAKSRGSSRSPRNSQPSRIAVGDQQGDEQGVGRTGRRDQPEVEDVGERRAERQADDRGPGSADGAGRSQG